MVANRTMGLLNCRVMTRDLWATDHRLARQTPPLTCYCVLEGLLWQKAAQWGLSAAHRSFFEPWIEALIVP